MKPTISVEDARGLIREGDIILFQGRYLVSWAYRAVTGWNWYTHAAIVAHWQTDWILLQAEAAGVQAVELGNAVAQYNGLSDWYALKDECRQKLDFDKMLHEARRDLGAPFGVLQFLLHLTHWWLGYSTPRTRRHEYAYFCSQYVAHCFRKGNLPLLPMSDIDTMPDDLSQSQCLEGPKAL